MFGLDGGGMGQSVLDGREDLHALDRVDAQVAVELHLQLEHVERVSRFLGDHLRARPRSRPARPVCCGPAGVA